MTRLLYLLLLAELVTDCCPAPISCVVPRSSATRFTVAGRKNQTGHWITQLHMISGIGQLTTVSSAKDTWDVEIEHRPPLCQDISMQNIAEIVAPPVRVGTDYELMSGLGYYKVHTTPSVWEIGRRTCDEEGAHLVILNSDREAAVVERLFQNTPALDADNSKPAMFYVGVSDIFEEGNFVTIFG